MKKKFILNRLVIASFFLFVALINWQIGWAMGGPGGSGCPGTGSCGQTNTLGQIISVTNGTAVTSTSGGSIAGAPGSGANPPLVINATSCGPVSLTVRYSFTWNQGSTYNWIHGVSFSNTASNAGTGSWIAASPTVPAGWVYMPSGVTGICSGNQYGPGYYYDASSASSAPSQFQLDFAGPGMCTAIYSNTDCDAVCNSDETQVGTNGYPTGGDCGIGMSGPFLVLMSI
ncbi:MAG: hypothetical protein IPL35_00265 [Sphingobacteriales bacterium]|nr:hypothetical protein [Sphingobacteriales bacterium]